MIELTDLQEDILTLAVDDPDRTNEEIADVLDCSPDWVGEVRRKYEHKVAQSEVTDELKTVPGTASNPPKPRDEKKAENYAIGIVLATGAWWFPVLGVIQGETVPAQIWLLMAGGWIGVPALVFLDCKERRSLGGGLVYTVAGVFLPMFSGLVYLYRRS